MLGGGVELVVDPETTGQVLGFIAIGIALGTVSGLTPGLHANNFALLLAATAPSLPGPPLYVGVAMLAAGVVHTFLDIVPAVALGVPDAAMAASALPGHRLVIDGRGHEAVRLSALGSGLAIVFAVPLAIPVTALMVRLYPLLQPHLSAFLLGLAGFLVLTEGTTRGRVGGLVAFLGSAALGLATLDRNPSALLDAGGMLAPLFAGLFGAPVLLDAMRGAGVPAQGDARITSRPRGIAVTALLGTIAGALVGYLPAVSSAIAAVVVLTVLPAGSGARRFIIATSGVNTANTVFALFALVALGTPRTGVLVALDQTGVPLNLPILLATVVLAGSAAFVLVPLVGDHYLEVIRRVDYTRLSLGILLGLVGIAYVFAGPIGVGAFAASAVLGLLPPRFGAKRVHLMGVLMGPLILHR